MNIYKIRLWLCIIYSIIKMEIIPSTLRVSKHFVTVHTLPIKQRMRGQGMVLIGIPQSPHKEAH